MATQSDSTNTGVVATIVVVGAFAMIAISALLVTLVRSEESKLDESRPMHADLETVAALERAQLADLGAAPRWEDQAKGKVAIPIERAMKLVLKEYAKDPAAASPPPPPGMVMAPTGGTVPGETLAPTEGAPESGGAEAPAAGSESGTPTGAAPTPAAPAPALPPKQLAPAVPTPKPTAPAPTAPRTTGGEGTP